MFNLSGSEIIVILLLALVVLGPDKLPDALRKAGRTYAELRKMTTTFQREMSSAMDEPMREARETADLLRKSTQFDADAAEPPPAAASTGAATVAPPQPSAEPTPPGRRTAAPNPRHSEPTAPPDQDTA